MHAGIRPEDIDAPAGREPHAEFLVHPECGCASQCMAFGNENTHILSTEGMIRFAKASPKDRFLIATETGIFHRLQKEAPEKRFEAVSENAICRYMKMITLQKLRDSLHDWKYEVTVPRGHRGARARCDRQDGRDLVKTLTSAQTEFLENPFVGVVTDLRPDGSPHSTVVWVDVDDDGVSFNTAWPRAKPRYLEADRACRSQSWIPAIRIDGSRSPAPRPSSRTVRTIRSTACRRSTRGGRVRFAQRGETRVSVRISPTWIEARGLD